MPLLSDVKFDNGKPWPRIYSTTLTSRLLMNPSQLEALWAEYRAFWADVEMIPRSRQEVEYQKDWLEDKVGTYR